MLITETKQKLSGGVNQQSAEHRLSSQVEEMINCVPTLDRGLVKRNPTTGKKLTYSDGTEAKLDFEGDMWTYEYDRGSGASSSQEFSFSITSKGLQILNVNTGVVYNKDNGIKFQGVAEQYLMPFAGRIGYSATTVKDTVFLVNKAVNPKMLPVSETHNYKRDGYVWIKRIDPIDGYTYGASIVVRNTNGSTSVVKIPYGTPQLTSQGAAGELGTAIRNTYGFGLTSWDGSLVQIRLSGVYDEIVSVSSLDSFGDTASFGWGHNVDVLSDLPKNMASFSPLCRIGNNDKSSYWLHYQEGLWKESYEIGIKHKIDNDRMPYVIEKQFDFSVNNWVWTMKPFAWDNRTIGDDTTNQLPQFLNPDDRVPIKEIFFFRNRMGLMTSSGICMSEVGEYGNFFRTSAAALLDSDRIDVGIESRRAINLEYATVMEDSVILFSDKSQFKFEGGDILSPTANKVTEITSYEIDHKIRPLLMNDRIFFVSPRGKYSAIMQMFIANNSTRSSKAQDITAHVQQYISRDLDRLTGSPVNNMLFISSYNNRRLAYVYKYYEVGSKLEQSAWFKWEFNGNIFAAFAMGSRFHLYIDREGGVSETDWIMGDGQWNMNKKWHMNESPWLMSPDSLISIPQFESMDIVPQHHMIPFYDNARTIINSFVSFGEWVQGADGNKQIRGTLKFKTVQLSYEEGSRLELWIKDIRLAHDKERIIDFERLRGRRPMVYGDAKNMRVGIRSDDEFGFRLNTVSFEGELNRRAKAK